MFKRTLVSLHTWTNRYRHTQRETEADTNTRIRMYQRFRYPCLKLLESPNTQKLKWFSLDWSVLFQLFCPAHTSASCWYLAHTWCTLYGTCAYCVYISDFNILRLHTHVPHFLQTAYASHLLDTLHVTAWRHFTCHTLCTQRLIFVTKSSCQRRTTVYRKQTPALDLPLGSK